LDTTQVGTVAAELMDTLAEDQERDTDELTVGVVMVLVEVQGTDEDGDSWTWIRYRCSDPRVWIQRGMLHAALEQDQLPDLEDEDESEDD
jgi:hypothetical protein